VITKAKATSTEETFCQKDTASKGVLQQARVLAALKFQVLLNVHIFK